MRWVGACSPSLIGWETTRRDDTHGIKKQCIKPLDELVQSLAENSSHCKLSDLAPCLLNCILSDVYRAVLYNLSRLSWLFVAQLNIKRSSLELCSKTQVVGPDFSFSELIIERSLLELYSKTQVVWTDFLFAQLNIERSLLELCSITQVVWPDFLFAQLNIERSLLKLCSITQVVWLARSDPFSWYIDTCHVIINCFFFIIDVATGGDLQANTRTIPKKSLKASGRGGKITSLGHRIMTS